MNKYYAVLGLPSTATKEEVRRKYRQLVLIWHPDRNSSPEAHGKFIAITEAYDILMGERKAPRVTYSRPSATTSRPRPKTSTYKSAQTARQEAQKSHAELQREKFENIRQQYLNAPNRATKMNEMYTKANLYFVGAGGSFLLLVLIPFIAGSPWNLIWTLPVGLGLGLRLLWRGGRYKLRADMIFGGRKDYTAADIKEFFTESTGYKYRQQGGGGRWR